MSAPCTWEEIERGEVTPAHVHAAEHARSHREGWRCVGRHAAPRAIVEAADGKAAPLETVNLEVHQRTRVYPIPILKFGLSTPPPLISAKNPPVCCRPSRMLNPPSASVSPLEW